MIFFLNFVIQPPALSGDISSSSLNIWLEMELLCVLVPRQSWGLGGRQNAFEFFDILLGAGVTEKSFFEGPTGVHDGGVVATTE